MNRAHKLNYKMIYKRIITILLVAWCISGCGMKMHHKLYEGPTLPRDKIAILKGSSPIMLYEIDGIPGPNFACSGCRTQYNSKWDHSYSIDLLPGSHKLVIGYSSWSYGYRSSTETYSASDQILYFDAKPGAVYAIQPMRLLKRWSSQVIEMDQH